MIEVSDMSGHSSVEPALSITVLNYNYARYLPTCLDSILRQSFTDFELILINDASTDDSIHVISRYCADSRVRLIDHSVNAGFLASLLEGVDASRGRYVTVVSADDWLTSDHSLERMIDVLEREPTVSMAYGAYGLYGDDGVRSHLSRAGESDSIRPGRAAFEDFVLNGYPLHSGTVVRRTAYDRMGGYDTSVVFSLDAQLFLGLCWFGDVAYVDDELVAYRRHRASMSRDARKLREAIEEVLRLLDWAISLGPEQARDELASLRRRGRQRALTSFAADAVFSGRYTLGLRYLWVGVRLSPWETLVQRSTAAILLRLVLRERGYRWVVRHLGQNVDRS
jgi:glycosyltransferase involved in cell wall biosynthesis